MADIGDICEFYMEEERDCKMCSLGNPCLNCKDYDSVNELCKSNGACFEITERRTDG
jgi:hypothetical protein